MREIWAIVPVKVLKEGKSRLSNLLSVEERVTLTTEMVSHLLTTINACPSIEHILVVSRDSAVLKIAHGFGAATFSVGPGHDLNATLQRASQVAFAKGARELVILPADLPYVTSEEIEALVPEVADWFENRPERQVILAPNEAGTKINGLYLSHPTGFEFQYGPNSLVRHVEEAERLGMPYRFIRRPGLAFDLDTEQDWQRYVVEKAAGAIPA